MLPSHLRAVLLLALAPVAHAQTQELGPRSPEPAAPVRAHPFPDAALPGLDRGYRLIVKFDDAARARAVGGVPESQVGADLAAVRALAASEGLVFTPALNWSETRAAALEQRAAVRSGRAQPDLLGLHYVTVPGNAPEQLEVVGNRLAALPGVEYAEIEALGVPPPGDIAPPTPNLAASQGYTQPNPGMYASVLWAEGIRGQGVRLADCEYGWVTSHEDLVDAGVVPEPGQTPVASVASFGWDEHGTAALGASAAPWNGFGVNGLAPLASFATFPEWTVQGGSRRLQAITNAIDTSKPGDVVLLEMQTNGAGGGFGPAELVSSIRIVCKLGVDAGVVVVGAAGNGNQNLDAAAYASYMAAGDSGAILVGAGSANSGHNKLGFSTYGSRVDVQGWGESVFTLGYGDYAAYGGDKNQRYTASFSGTSSGSAVVAGAAVLLQSAAIERVGAPLDPLVLRDILVATGTPQGSGGAIGPLPNLEAALDYIDSLSPATQWQDLGFALPGTAGVPVLTGSGNLTSGGTLTLALSGAPVLAPCALFAGTSNLSLPFAGGTFVPSPDVYLPFPTTTLQGTLPYQVQLPPGVPPGAALWFQYWILDPFAPSGLSASNAVSATAP